MIRAQRFRKIVVAAGVLIVFPYLSVVFLSVHTTPQYVEMNRWVAHTQKVIVSIGQLQLLCARLENEARGFLSTGNLEHSISFQNDRRRLEQELARLKQLTADDPEQQEILAESSPALTGYIKQLEQTMTRTSPKGASAGKTAELTDTHSAVEKLRTLFDKMEVNQHGLLEQRSKKSQAEANWIRVALILSGLLAIAILVVAGYLIQRELILRAQIEAGLRLAGETLGARYEEQRAELSHALEDVHTQIGERRRAEEEVRNLNRELEEHVKQRTGELEETNRELEAFSYSVSNDLRAPLRHMDGFLQILTKEYAVHLPPEAQQYLDRIHKATAQMHTLVEVLLGLSRIGRQALRYELVSLHALADEAMSQFGPETARRPIDWRIGPMSKVEGDAGLLRQAFVNLFENAVKFTRRCDRSVIEVGCVEKNSHVVVFVRDNGVGFDPRFADKLFGVFQRMHPQGEFEGTGLGLATVQRIIHKHGGRIWAESKLGQGATFFFSLPLHRRSPSHERLKTGMTA